LAEDEGLLARRQGGADDGPFLEGDAQAVHVGHSSPRGERCIRSRTAASGAFPSYSTRYTSVMIGTSIPIRPARSWTARAVFTPSATLLMLAWIAPRPSPLARRSPTRRFRPCRLKQVVIRSPSPARPANVAPSAPSATAKRVISTRPRVTSAD